MPHNFLTVHEVIALHDALIEEFGGPAGLRDMGALESAIMRPQIGYYDSLIEEATALMESLAMNHPFMDGKKQVYFAATEALLGMNGYLIDCDSEEAYAHFVELFETNSFRFGELKSWLESTSDLYQGTGSNRRRAMKYTVISKRGQSRSLP